MNKKTWIVILVLVVVFAGGGFLMWQNSQAAVKDLNNTLPEGVRVVKSMFGNEYKVVNKIDGYEFKVPGEWKGLEKIEYFPQVMEGQYEVASINITGLEGLGRFIAVDKFFFEEETDLDITTKKILATNELVSDLKEDKIGNFDIIKTQGVQGLGGLNVSFFKVHNNIYAITWGSEQFSKRIILTGKW